MTYSELTGTQLIRNFSKLMNKAMQGIPLIFSYKGKTFEINIKEKETQGQKLARLLNESTSEREVDNSPYPYKSNREMYGELLKKYD